MRRFITLISFCIITLLAASIAASDIQEWLQTPVWYLNYDVTFAASYDTAFAGPNGGTQKITIAVTRSFASQEVFDLRNDGPSVYSSMAAAGAGGTPDMNAVLANMGSAANWTPGAVTSADDATDEQMEAANKARIDVPLGPAKLDYLRVDVCDKCINEMGTTVTITTRTIKTSSGTVRPRGATPLTFEINAKEKKYSLFLTPGYTDNGTMLKSETIDSSAATGQEPVVSRSHGEVGLSMAPSNELQFNDPKQIALAMIWIKGDIDPASDKISGERTIPASYQDGRETVSGTVTVHYTVSKTPPAKAATGK